MKLLENSIIDSGKFKGMKLSDVISGGKKNVFELIKEGYVLDDSILNSLSIKKTIRSVSGNCIVTEHDNSELKIKMKTDNIDLNTIINDMNYINSMFNSTEDFELDDTFIDEENN